MTSSEIVFDIGNNKKYANNVVDDSSSIEGIEMDSVQLAFLPLDQVNEGFEYFI